MRLCSDGSYNYCRWATTRQTLDNIKDVAPVTFFRERMSDLRAALLDGQVPEGCSACQRMDRHGKVSGRLRQLLKTGIRTENFAATTQSSPYYDQFLNSIATGSTDLLPVDWQIDLGNYCNGACVFCGPESSSRLATEFKRIGIFTGTVPRSWAEDPAQVERLIGTLKSTRNLRYLHFIGGETVITPAFKTILKALVSENIIATSIGFTTNLTVWDEEVISLLAQFESVHLGMSIESFAPVNDYARWPATHAVVQPILRKWVEIARELDWYMQLRTTPTALTIQALHTVYDFAFKEGIAVESCNFLESPEFLRASVLPIHERRVAMKNIQDWILSVSDDVGEGNVVNTRNPVLARAQVLQDARSYLNYLQHEPDETFRLPALASYLSKIDNSRNISVFDYLPHYEELFRTAGYTD